MGTFTRLDGKMETVKIQNGSDGKEITVNFSLRFNKRSAPWIDEAIDKIWNELYEKNQSGKVDRPGGHPEPDNVPQLSQHADRPEHSNNQIREEIFDSVLNEIRDEINLPRETLSDPLLIGFVRNLERFGRPTAEFV